jgi:cytochrome b subunit of formate dehydrogenase
MGRGMLVLTKPPKLSVMLRKKEDKEWAYEVLRRWKGEIEKGF